MEGHGKIKDSFRRLGDKTLHSDKFIFTFLRSAVSSQCASWVDMGVGFLLFALLSKGIATGMDDTVLAGITTAIGAFCGGVVNCIINYKFTFHADGVDWRAVMVKYTMVWFGSMLLNTFGTGALYALLNSWDWLESIGFRRDGFYATARLLVSLIVSWFWNFPMQRYFVYRATRFDRFAIGFCSFFKRRSCEDNTITVNKETEK